jgi:DNA-binding Lrp family transcriptional regulator
MPSMHRLDDLDVKILKELGSPSSPQWNVRETYSSIARKVGVDEETVRRRLKRAEKLGSMPGWRMMLNPRLIGYEAASLDFEVNSDDEQKKDKTIAEIERINGVIKILDFRGRGLQITLYYQNDDDLKSKIGLIKSSSDSPKDPTVWKLGFPRTDIRMTTTDWRILDAILEDPRKSLEVVSKVLGLSVRTIERRMTAITESRAVYLQGIPNFRAHTGLSCVFLVFCPEEQHKKAVDEMILSKLRRIDLSNTSSKQYSTFVMVYDNLSEADEATKWMKSLDGVKSVKMGIMNELFVIQDWLRSEINQRISTHSP